MSDNDLSLQEMMEIEIKFGKGKTDHVVVHYGDDPYSLAQAFVDRHRLKSSSVSIIADYIRNTIEDFQAQMKEMAMQSPSLEDGGANMASTFPPPAAALPEPPMSNKESEEQKSQMPHTHEQSSSSRGRKHSNNSDNDSITTLPPGPLQSSYPTSTYPTSQPYPSSYPSANNQQSNNSISSSQDHHASEYDDDGRASLSTTTTVPTNPIPHVHSSPGPVFINTSPKQVLSSRKPYQETPNRSRAGSFSLTTSHKGELEYDITRFQTDSLHASREGLEGGDYGIGIRMEEDEIDGDGFRDDVEDADDDLFDAVKTLSPFKPKDSDKVESNQGHDDYEEEEEEREPEETEEEKYNRLMNQAKKPASKSSRLQPASKTLVIKKHFHLTDSKPGVVPLKGKNTKPVTIPKTAHERLYVHAELKRSKNEKLKAIQDKQEDKEIAENQYKLNPVSAQLATHNDHIYAHYDNNITEKLYQEGKKHLEQKHDKNTQATSMQAKYVYDWSCAKCGNLHKVSRNVLNEHTPLHMIPRLYVCSICQFDQSESILSHKPTNIGLLYNPEIESNVLHRRQQAIEQVELKDDLNTYNTQLKNDSKVHEYLYTEGRMQDKILKFNAVLYQEMQTKLTFAPSLPSNTVELLEKMRDAGDHDVSAQQSLEGGSISSTTQHSANPKVERAEYLRTNILTRLTEPTHYTTSYKEMQKARKPKPKVVPEPLRGEKEKFFNRLVYEYKEKNLKLQFDQDVYHSVDPQTKQPLYQPHVPSYPMQHTQTFTKMPIWQKLKHKDQRIRQKISDQHKVQVDKLLKELNEKSAKASDASNTILESSMEKNLEELFKLLLVTNEIYNEHVAKGGNEQEDGDENGQQESDTDDNKGKENKRAGLPHLNSSYSLGSHAPSFASLPADLDVDSVYTQAQKLENWESRSLDLLAILPNILINEVSTLLMDMQRVWHRRKEKQKVEKILFGKEKESGAVVGVADEIEMGEDEPLLITYPSFKQLARYCMKKRVGPGTSYLFAPRRPLPAPTPLSNPQDDEECTFTPSIDKHSVELLRSAGNMRVCVGNSVHGASIDGGGSAAASLDGSKAGPAPHIPIENILHAEGERVRNKQNDLRMRVALQESKECTYQPHLYRPPSYVQPRYTMHLVEEDGCKAVAAAGNWTTSQELRRERFVKYTAHQTTATGTAASTSGNIQSPQSHGPQSLSPIPVSKTEEEGQGAGAMRGVMMGVLGGEAWEVGEHVGDAPGHHVITPAPRSRSSSPSLASNSCTISTKFTVDLPSPPPSPPSSAAKHPHPKPTTTLHTPVPPGTKGLRRLESGGGFSWHQHIQSTPGGGGGTPFSSATHSRASEKGGSRAGGGAGFDLSYSRSDDVPPPPPFPSMHLAPDALHAHPALKGGSGEERGKKIGGGYSSRPQPALYKGGEKGKGGGSNANANTTSKPLPLLPEETRGRPGATSAHSSKSSMGSADVSRPSSYLSTHKASSAAKGAGESQTGSRRAGAGSGGRTSSRGALGQGLDDSSVLSYSDSSSTVKRKK